MTNENPELKKQQSISAAEHPKAWDPQVMILGLPLAIVGCIIGLELIVRTGVTPNTSIIGALFAILLSRIPVAFLRKYRSIHRQNLLQTSISAATFSAANCMILPIGIPVIMGYPELMFPMLIGVMLATCVDATILYNCFGSEMSRQRAHGRLEWQRQIPSWQLSRKVRRQSFFWLVSALAG